jgi:hypothetical protein
VRDVQDVFANFDVPEAVLETAASWARQTVRARKGFRNRVFRMSLDWSGL